MPTLNLDSFHDYDIRGIYPTQVDEEFFYHLGKSYSLYFKKGPVVVGQDTRPSSPALTKAFIEGMTDYGVDVIDMGQISTEMHNFSSAYHHYVANIMITASHNPPEYNGVKSALHGVIPLHSAFGLPEVKAFMNQDIPKAEIKGTVEKQDFFKEWIDYVATAFPPDEQPANLTVVVDAGNGMGGPAWKAMQEKLPSKIIDLYLNPDGSFPHHVPDPSKDKNLQDLASKIIETNADFGIAIDGDADRAVFVDNTGKRVTGTIAVALLAAQQLEIAHKKMPANARKAVMYDATVGKIVSETIKKNGGVPLRTRVGHSYIKAHMKEEQAIFAGEESGHFYFAQNGSAESSLMAGLLMMQIVAKAGKPLSEIVKEYSIYARSGETNFQVPAIDDAIKAIHDTFKSKASSTDELDGYTFFFDDWWFVIRRSKTEPLLRIFMEANSQELLDVHMKEVEDILISHGATKKG